MIRMCGRKVQVLKYQVTYTENDEFRTDYAASEEEAHEIADHVGGMINNLPESEDAWMDGMEVADVPDTYGEAMRICHLGYAKWIENAKAEKIQKSRDDLEAYLEAHPITWTDGNQYSITREKQQQLTSKILSATLAAQTSTPYTLKWNATGEECTPWTLEELAALAFAIDGRVTDLVSYQQAKEVAMREADSLEALAAIEVDYDTVG